MEPIFDLGEWLLFEREYDRANRDAAVKSFEKFKKTVGVIFDNKKVLDMVYLVHNDNKGVIPDNDIYTIYPKLWAAFKAAFSKYTSRYLLQFTILGGGKPDDVVLTFKADKLGWFKSAGFEIYPDFIKPQKDLKFTVKLTSASIGANVGGQYSTMTMWLPRVSAFNQTDICKMLHDCYKTYSGASKRVDNKASRIYNAWLEEFMKQIESKRSIYIHEYTHHLDQMRYKVAVGERPKSIERGIKAFQDAEAPNLTKDQVTAKYNEYFTDDAELNAYYQETMGNLQDAVQKWLIAATNTRALIILVDGQTMTLTMPPITIDEFNKKSVKERCRLISRVVLADFNRILRSVTSGKDSMDNRITGDLKVIYDANFGSVSEIYMKLVSKTLFAYANSAWIMAVFNNPRLKRKFMNRLYSTSQDIKAIVKDYENDMANGKSPSIQEFNTAIEKMRSNTPGIHGFLYTGLFMRSGKHFDPRKNYSIKDA